MMSLININIFLLLIGCCSQRLNGAPLELSEFDVEFVSSIVPSPGSSMPVVSTTPLVLSNPAPSPTPALVPNNPAPSSTPALVSNNPAPSSTPALVPNNPAPLPTPDQKLPEKSLVRI